MALKTVCLENLPAELVVEVDDLLRKAIRDCADRPQYGKARVLTLQIAITPEDTKQATCKGVTIEPQVKLTLPASGASPIRATIRNAKDAATGMALWNDMSHDDARQATVDQVDPETGEVRD